MYASNSHSYTHLILALGIVREPTVWDFMTSQYFGIHDIGLPNVISSVNTSKHCPPGNRTAGLLSVLVIQQLLIETELPGCSHC